MDNAVKAAIRNLKETTGRTLEEFNQNGLVILVDPTANDNLNFSQELQATSSPE
jgi:hypothetical protein